MAGTAGGSGNQVVNKDVNCFKCGKLGHYANACTDTRPKCFNCDKFGHTASQCRAPKTEPSRIYDEDSRESAAHYKSLKEKKEKGQFRGKPYGNPVDNGKQEAGNDKKPSGGGAPNPVRCYKCGVEGHRSPECPNSEAT
ncbi:uncharacterized protein LOC130712743 [Lotus japonicus]|uniref:uncharacterized protein LOC130712743 n=1 Tax=Lotus japonicus TaxID=34305 RepID=UPI002582718D|nr:uncharacterized protein LOC130712743 [Lotus japonicus]